MNFYAIEFLYQQLQKRFPADPIILKQFDPEIPWFEQVEPTRCRKRNLLKDKIDFSSKKETRLIDDVLVTLVDISRNLRYDPRMVKIFYEYENVAQFFEKIFDDLPVLSASAFEDVKDDVVSFLYDWERIMMEKVEIVARTSNAHLANLPFPEKADWFSVKVLELNASNTMTVLHPLTEQQYTRQLTRSNELLLKTDSKDPIGGYRVLREGDKSKWAASMVCIMAGHHRTHEIYSRYLQGKIDGETLINFKQIR